MIQIDEASKLEEIVKKIDILEKLSSLNLKHEVPKLLKIQRNMDKGFMEKKIKTYLSGIEFKMEPQGSFQFDLNFPDDNQSETNREES